MDNNGFGSDSERHAFLKAHRGIITRVAEKLRMSPAAVSRTFHGVTRDTNPEIVKAIAEALAEVRKTRKR
jgi:hypothetical protein